MRIGDALDLGGLFHQLFVDMRTARRIEHHDVITTGSRGRNRALGDLDGRLVGDDLKHIDADLAAERFELFHGGRTARIERGHKDALALLVGKAFGDLARCRRFARTLQADHEDRHRRGRIERNGRSFLAQNRDELVMNDLDDLLARLDRPGDFRAHGARANLFGKGAHHFERNVGLDQRAADLAQRGLHIGFAERTSPGDPGKDLAQAV